MEKTESVWLTREEVWQKVVEPLLADPVAREAYDFRWEDFGNGVSDLYLSDRGEDGPCIALNPTWWYIAPCPCDNWFVYFHPLPEGMEEKDWPRHVSGCECGIDGSHMAEENVERLAYGDPVSLMAKESLLTMAKDILWIMAGATSSQARSTGKPWRAEHNRKLEEWFVSAHPGEEPVEIWDVIPRYVIDVESPRAESLTMTFANLEFRLNCQNGFGPA